KYVSGAECDVAVIGLGFVGLPAAIMLAQGGKRVIGVDIDDRLIARLRAWDCPIHEAGVAAVFDDPATRKSFTATRTVPVADAFVLAVPTPLHARKKVADLEALETATASIVPQLR